MENAQMVPNQGADETAPTAEQRARAERTLLEVFGESTEAASVVSAPGRVNLIGGHTDYNEGFVLPMAIDRRTVVAARPRADGTVKIHSIDFGETRRFPLDRIEPSTDTDWLDYVKGVTARLLARGHELDGVELVVDGGVPIGAGLASSAALEVAVGGAVSTISGHPFAGDLVDVCWEAETQFVGVSCGIMDQYTAVHGERGRALFLDCRTVDHEVVPVPAADVTVLATDTTVSHDLVDSAYNDRVETCAAAVGFFDDVLDEEVRALRDVSVAAFEEWAPSLSETVRKRVRHVVTENERVRDAAAALRGGDLDRVGDLLLASHASLRDDYEVSAAELDAVVEIADEQDGVFGSRMTGAGFGGCVVTLVRPNATADVIEAITDGYVDRTGIEPDVYACEPDSGLRHHER